MLFSAIMLYCDTGEKTELPLAASIVFDVLVDVIATNYQKWQEKAQERTEKARSAAGARWNNAKTAGGDAENVQELSSIPEHKEECSSIRENAQACSSMLKHNNECSSIFSDARDALSVSVSVSDSVSVLENNTPLPPLRGDTRAHAREEIDSDSTREEVLPDESLPDTKGTATETKKQREQRLRGLFAEFWTVYPRKVAKAAAEKAFLKLAPSDDLLAEMIASVKLQTDTVWRGKDEQYIPHASTWLNRRQWEDEIEARAAPPAGRLQINSFRNTDDEERMLARNRHVLGGDDP